MAPRLCEESLKLSPIIKAIFFRNGGSYLLFKGRILWIHPFLMDIFSHRSERFAVEANLDQIIFQVHDKILDIGNNRRNFE